MLRVCVLVFGGKWEEHLPFAEFAYNNSYQASIGMAPYEALCTVDLVDHLFVGPSIKIILFLGLITSGTPLRLSRQSVNGSRRPKVGRRVMLIDEGDH